MCENKISLSKEEEEKVKQAIAEENERIRKELLEAEIRNRILAEQRSQPGYAGY